MNDVYENIEKCNAKKEHKILIEFDNMIADMIIKEKTDPILTELFIRGRKLSISLIFITQCYFTAPKGSRQNSTICFIMKFFKNSLQNHIVEIYSN